MSDETKLRDNLRTIEKEMKAWGDCAVVDLWYPRSNPIRAIQVGLMDVRAADDLRIEYDFERDGWVIKQAQRFRWKQDEKPDPQWKEVAFVQGLGLTGRPR